MGEIAQGAEVPDEGQTSKLLARLTRVGLIANTKPHGPATPTTGCSPRADSRRCPPSRPLEVALLVRAHASDGEAVGDA
jgi:hypothetical protein